MSTLPITGSMFRWGVLPALHALVTGLLGGIIGLGITSVTVHGASGTAAGIVTAAAIYEAGLLITYEGFGRSFKRRSYETDEQHVLRKSFWFASMLLWLAAGVPLAADLAPGYALHGVLANVVPIFLVPVAVQLAYKASPWRGRWSRTRSSAQSAA